MASSSGITTSSGSLHNTDLYQQQQQLQRKMSNRESARRSRVRKQKHLDDLMAQLAQLRKANNQLVMMMNVTAQRLLHVEAENSVLRAQMAQLDARLDSLNEIIGFLDAKKEGFALDEEFCYNAVNDSADLFHELYLEMRADLAVVSYWSLLYIEDKDDEIFLMPSSPSLSRHIVVKVRVGSEKDDETARGLIDDETSIKQKLPALVSEILSGFFILSSSRSVISASLLSTAYTDAGQGLPKYVNFEKKKSVEAHTNDQTRISIHKRLLRVKTNDYGSYDPAPTFHKPKFKQIPN
ncbi:hypothetical protein ACET3Z_004611 [Daucus carota]